MVTSQKITYQCLIAWAFVLLALSVNAETITGQVVAIADGDTITVLDAGKVQHKIRLGGIDAPETGQSLGTDSGQHIAELGTIRIRCTVGVQAHRR